MKRESCLTIVKPATKTMALLLLSLGCGGTPIAPTHAGTERPSDEPIRVPAPTVETLFAESGAEGYAARNLVVASENSPSDWVPGPDPMFYVYQDVDPSESGLSCQLGRVEVAGDRTVTVRQELPLVGGCRGWREDTYSPGRSAGESRTECRDGPGEMSVWGGSASGYHLVQVSAERVLLARHASVLSPRCLPAPLRLACADGGETHCVFERLYVTQEFRSPGGGDGVALGRPLHSDCPVECGVTHCAAALERVAAGARGLYFDDASSTVGLFRDAGNCRDYSESRASFRANLDSR